MILADLPLISTPKMTIAVSSLGSGIISFIGAQVTGITHESAGLTACIVAGASLLGALFAKLPDIIKAKSESKKVEITLQDDGQDKLIKHIYEAHDREREATERVLTQLQKEVERLQAENVLLRISKHAALNECNRMVLGIAYLHEMMRQANLPVPDFKQPDLVSILREEDTSMKQLTGVPAAPAC